MQTNKPPRTGQVLRASGEVGSSSSLAQEAPLPALPARKEAGRETGSEESKGEGLASGSLPQPDVSLPLLLQNGECP